MPRRSTALYLALGLAAASVTVLGVVGLTVARYFRSTAEGVVRDHTALAADRLAEVVSTGVAQRFAPLLGLARTALAGRDGGRLPSPAELRRVRGPMDNLAGGIENVFHLDSATGQLRGSDAAPSPALERRLRSLAGTAPSALPRSAYFGLDWPSGQEGTVVAFDLLRDTTGRAPGLYGLAVPLDTVVALLDRITTGRRFLPPRLASRIPGDSVIGFRLEVTGRVLLDRGFDPTSPWGAETDLGPMYGHLSGRVALEPAQASRLIVGGLPRYQAPLLAGFLGLAIASLAALGVVVRRERLLQKTREDFVAGVSHELRTPLAQLRLFGETLALGRVRSDEERSRSLDIIRQETARLAHLVDNLLVFSRRERNGLRLGFERTDLSGLLDRIVDEFVPLAAVATAREIEPGIVADVDPGAIRQMVLNLLDNAVKYGRPSQTVRVGLRTIGRDAEITVTDEGPGVPAAERELVWQRFWRGPGATARGIGGTGIGLAIVADLVRAHDGTVAVGAVAPAGARFEIRVPLERNGRPG